MSVDKNVALTEGILSFLADRVSDSNKKIKIPSKLRKSGVQYSIKDRANKYNAIFPLITSDTVDQDTLEAISSVEELRRAVEFQVVLNNSGMTDSLVDSNLHTNYAGFQPYNTPQLEATVGEQLMEREKMFRPDSLNEYTLPNDYRKARLAEGTQVVTFKEDNEYSLIGEGAELVSGKNELHGVNKETGEEEFLGDGIPASNIHIDSQDVATVNRIAPLRVTAKVGGNKPDSPELLFTVKSQSILIKNDELRQILTERAKSDGFIMKIVRLFSGEYGGIVGAFKAYMDAAKKKSGVGLSHNAKVLNNMNMIFDTNRAANLARIAGNKLGKGYIPNMTMLLTIDDVRSIQRKSGKNIIDDTSEANRLFNQFMMIDLFIVDDVNDQLYEFDATTKSWEIRSLNTVKAVALNNIIKSKKNMADLDEKNTKGILSRI